MDAHHSDPFAPLEPLATAAVIDSAVDCPDIPILEGAGTAKAVIWPGVGALHRSFQMIALPPGARTRVLRHEGESAYYVVAGSGSVVDEPSAQAQALSEGAMIHIGPGDSYRLAAAEAGMTILGGPCPADPALYAHLSQGWR